MIMETISKWLTDICQEQHLSLRGAASKTGLSDSTIAGLEQGVSPSSQTLKKLAQGFGGGTRVWRSSILKGKGSELCLVRGKTNG